MGGVEEGAASRETDIHWVRNRVLLKLTVWKERGGSGWAVVEEADHRCLLLQAQWP